AAIPLRAALGIALFEGALPVVVQDQTDARAQHREESRRLRGIHARRVPGLRIPHRRRVAVGGADLPVLHTSLNQELAPERVVAARRRAEAGIRRDLPQRARLVALHGVVTRTRLDAEDEVHAAVIARKRRAVDQRVSRNDTLAAAALSVVQTVLDQSG